MTLLYLDLLGTRSRWHRTGRSGAEATFRDFEALLRGVLHDHPARVTRGGVETDAAALICPSTEDAIFVGSEIYRRAFLSPRRVEDDRLWVRGAITEIQADVVLRQERSLEPALDHVRVYDYAGPLLDGISIERAGFKGMRLVIVGTLVTEPVRRRYAVPVGELSLIPFRRLDHSGYPGRLIAGFQDVLWMATPNEELRTALMRRMADRLRWSAGDQEEFLQAAATQVVFNECTAIFHDLRLRTDQR